MGKRKTRSGKANSILLSEIYLLVEINSIFTELASSCIILFASTLSKMSQGCCGKLAFKLLKLTQV